MLLDDMVNGVHCAIARFAMLCLDIFIQTIGTIERILRGNARFPFFEGTIKLYALSYAGPGYGIGRINVDGDDMGSEFADQEHALDQFLTSGVFPFTLIISPLDQRINAVVEHVLLLNDLQCNV